jgi:heterodisulfide reductase subunit A
MTEEELRIGVFVCDCGMNIAGFLDCDAIRDYAEGLDGVAVAIRTKYACSEPGQDEIKQQIKEHNLNRIVVASCSPRMHEPTFRACLAQAGLNPYLLEMANIREQCSWVHSEDRKTATEKAKDLIGMAVSRARLLKPQYEKEIPVTDAVLVIGGGIAGIQASLDLADSGHQVYLVEKEASIGGLMAQIDKTFPSMDCSI